MHLKVIRFVCHHDNRLFITAQYLGHFDVQVRDTVQYIHHKQDHVCFIQSDLYLLIYLFFENIIRINYPSAGVDQRKLFTGPVHFTVLTVAGSPCFLVHDGLTRLGQTVEQGGLSYVGPTNNCYNISHKFLFCALFLIQLITKILQQVIPVTVL